MVLLQRHQVIGPDNPTFRSVYSLTPWNWWNWLLAFFTCSGQNLEDFIYNVILSTALPLKSDKSHQTRSDVFIQGELNDII